MYQFMLCNIDFLSSFNRIAVRTIANPPRGFGFFLAHLWSLGLLRNKWLCLGRLPKPNTEHLPPQPLSCPGYSQLLRELNVSVTQVHPPPAWCDNISAAYIATNPVFHACPKHIELDYHFVHDRIVFIRDRIGYVPTRDHIADILTKGLSRIQHSHFISKLTLTPSPLSLPGSVNQRSPITWSSSSKNDQESNSQHV